MQAIREIILSSIDEEQTHEGEAYLNVFITIECDGGGQKKAKRYGRRKKKGVKDWSASLRDRQSLKGHACESESVEEGDSEEGEEGDEEQEGEEARVQERLWDAQDAAAGAEEGQVMGEDVGEWHGQELQHILGGDAVGEGYAEGGGVQKDRWTDQEQQRRHQPLGQVILDEGWPGGDLYMVRDEHRMRDDDEHRMRDEHRMARWRPVHGA